MKLPGIFNDKKGKALLSFMILFALSCIFIIFLIFGNSETVRMDTMQEEFGQGNTLTEIPSAIGQLEEGESWLDKDKGDIVNACYGAALNYIKIMYCNNNNTIWSRYDRIYPYVTEGVFSQIIPQDGSISMPETNDPISEETTLIDLYCFVKDPFMEGTFPTMMIQFGLRNVVYAGNYGSPRTLKYFITFEFTEEDGRILVSSISERGTWDFDDTI